MTASVRWAHPRGVPPDRGTVATVGTYDGVHLGHWEVLQEITRRAKEAGRRSVLVTFDPHPLSVVRPAHAPPLLTTPREKMEILAESGLECAVFLDFTLRLSRYTPRRFVEEVLVGRLGVEELVIGYDHGFGRDRAGDHDTLREMGIELGFSVDVVSPVSAGGRVISSSRIRSAILTGDLADARACLGRPYSMRGTVIRGDGRGRPLGFPTANLHLHVGEKLLPPEGIYAVRVMRNGGVHTGALHLGPRPTFAGATPSIEVYILDFDGDLYGEELRVDFIERLREVRPYTTVEALIAQMGADVEEARRVVDADARRR